MSNDGATNETPTPASGPVYTIGHRGDTHRAGGCGCGGHDEELPELDARVIPHAVRHGAVLGALGQVRPGAGMVLAAPHDPKPLLAQIDELFGDQLERTYLTEGPDVWRIRFLKRAE